MRRRVPAPLLFSLLSVALHLAWGWLMPADGRVEHAALPSLVELELAASNPEPPAPSEPPVSEPAPQEPAPVAAAAPPEHAPTRRAPKTAPAQPAEPAPSALSINEQPAQPSAAEPAQPTAAASAPATLNLSARAAALTLQPAAPSSTPSDRCNPGRSATAANSCSPSELEHSAQAELTRNLRAAASSVPHLAAREKPRLQARSDGSYDYDGHVFSARVGRDGQVAFADSGTQVELRPSLIPFKATGDIGDMVDKLVLGKELYSAEKLWFLEQTRELREKLAAAYRLEEAARARRELEKELQHILNDRLLGLAQKHGAVFTLWQDCGDDDQAEHTRRQVEAFVQRFMPRGGELGFEQAELERFNAQRAGLRQFRPYPSNAGGAPG